MIHDDKKPILQPSPTDMTGNRFEMIRKAARASHRKAVPADVPVKKQD